MSSSHNESTPLLWYYHVDDDPDCSALTSQHPMAPCPRKQCMATSTRDVKSLLKTCEDLVVRNISVRNVFDILEWVEQYVTAAGPRLRERCIQLVSTTFETMRRVYGDAELRRRLCESCLGEKAFGAMQEESRRRQKLQRRLDGLQGRVPTAPVPHRDGDASGCSAVPDDRLSVAGNQWPDDVDPRQRERFLPAAVFRGVFGMAFHQFSQMPHWRQVELKKQAQLF